MADEDKDQLVPVGPGAEEEEIREESEERDDEKQESRAESEDERVGHDSEEEGGERGEIRSRRRAERHKKKENIQRDRLELGYLRQRNEQLERRQSELDARVANGEMVLIDNKISELDGQIREAERLQALAISKQDGQSAAEASRIARDLYAGRAQLQSVKNQRIVAARSAPQQQVDPEIQARAREWSAGHDWYDTNLRTADSRVAHAIETDLGNDGRYDPRRPEYWDELDRRLKKYLPHRYNGSHTRDDDEEDDDEREDTTERRPRGPQVRVGGRERPLRKNEVYISADRKEAMMEAGVWDDPKLRERYLKQYQKFDRESRRR